MFEYRTKSRFLVIARNAEDTLNVRKILFLIITSYIILTGRIQFKKDHEVFVRRLELV